MTIEHREVHRKYHEASSLFPLMIGEGFEALKVDIAANGLREAIWLHPDGSIIDGRNRHRACIETDIMPRFRTWDGKGSLVQFVISMNLQRRHLTSSQRAVVALELLPMLEAEAKERQGMRTDIVEIFPQCSMGKSRDEAASIAQTNPHYVSDAKKLQVEAPDLLAEVKVGDKTIPQANRELVKRQRQDAPPLPTEPNKYRVFYADLPWSYGNSGIIGKTDHYGHVGRHYPTMTITELCAMGEQIKNIAQKDAVLFLWVTSPLLEECFAVIHAWGFKYKASFVWDKIGHNFGHYNSVRHELLLICTRGSCTPDIDTLFDSVQSIQKSRKHSEKPREFRVIIDTLYPRGKRIELFARTETENWEAWGNEPAF